MNSTQASDLLRADHRRIETYLDGLHEALKHLRAERVSSVRQNFREIQRLARTHLEQEEGGFYPELRSLAPDVLTHMDEQHEVIRQTERYLDEILASLPERLSDRDFTELYRLGIEFHDAVQVHIVDEEDQLLKLADRQLSSRQQQLLFVEMQRIAAGAAPSEARHTP